MSGRYKINGVDLSEITGGTTLTTIGNFTNVPYSSTQTPQDIRHGNNTTNTTTNDSNNNGLNTYFCYHDDETPGIPFNNNGTSILQHNFSGAKIVLKKATIGTGETNVSIPSWCTGIKLYVKGNVGSAGNNATRNGENTNTGNKTLRGTGHVDVDSNKNVNINGWKGGVLVDRNTNNNENIHHHLVKRFSMVTKSGGTKGNSRTFWTPMILPLDSTKTNTIYANKASSYNEIIIKENGTSKYSLKVNFGGNGGNATAPNTYVYNVNHHNTNNDGDLKENHHNITINGITGGSNGANGSNGTVTTNITGISGCSYYDTLEVSNTASGLIEAYFFR